MFKFLTFSKKYTPLLAKSAPLENVTSYGKNPKDGIFFPQETVPKGGVFWIIKMPYCDYKIYNYKNSNDCNDSWNDGAEAVIKPFLGQKLVKRGI